ncbi:alpha/beta fold hydrolase [Oceanibaculum sp.]|uniref:alpha/beta fold hydrolase n=1 Tax=Oceanibaculum sp. TaxID=1903597 RepID=UPI0025876C5F|nr:alpha/beta fold hydrolase [Oceanibaculum sp.]MCH2396406.1 alpha/beta fold hydrolase [Oceanibaculum sp.]
MTLLTSRGALPLLRKGSLDWRPELAATAQRLRQSAEALDERQVEQALDAAAARRWSEFLKGVLAYRRHGYRRSLPDARTVWQEGATRLLAFAPKGRRTGRPVLVVPSLINRAYILDLTEERSFLRDLAARGFRPYLVDWGQPGETERGFTLGDYIIGRLDAALNAVLTETGTRPALVGYCMGGTMSVALAQRRQADLSGLALLTAPWDFQADPTPMIAALPGMLPGLMGVVAALGELPTDIIQSLFLGLDPHLGYRKFRTFAGLDPDSAKAHAFVALEDWLNDGVALAGPVARECLEGWYINNDPARGNWRVAGDVVDPTAIRLPSLAMVPADDRIVPPASALALATALPGCTVLRLPLGHIGMMAGGSAIEKVWSPLADWLKNHA